MSKEAENLHIVLTSLRTRAESAEAEVARLRKLFDDAGQGEHNVLALVDHYQRDAIAELDRRLETEARARELEELIQRTHGCHVSWPKEADRQKSIAFGLSAEVESRGRRIAELESEVAEKAEREELERRLVGWLGHESTCAIPKRKLERCPAPPGEVLVALQAHDLPREAFRTVGTGPTYEAALAAALSKCLPNE